MVAGRRRERGKMDNTLAAVEELARAKLGWSGSLEPGMRLVEDLELDSMGAMTLAIEIENHFRIVLEEEEEADLETVGDLVELIRHKQAAHG